MSAHTYVDVHMMNAPPPTVWAEGDSLACLVVAPGVKLWFLDVGQLLSWSAEIARTVTSAAGPEIQSGSGKTSAAPVGSAVEVEPSDGVAAPEGVSPAAGPTGDVL